AQRPEGTAFLFPIRGSRPRTARDANGRRSWCAGSRSNADGWACGIMRRATGREFVRGTIALGGFTPATGGCRVPARRGLRGRVTWIQAVPAPALAVLLEAGRRLVRACNHLRG